MQAMRTQARMGSWSACCAISSHVARNLNHQDVLGLMRHAGTGADPYVLSNRGMIEEMGLSLEDTIVLRIAGLPAHGEPDGGYCEVLVPKQATVAQVLQLFTGMAPGYADEEIVMVHSGTHDTLQPETTLDGYGIRADDLVYIKEVEETHEAEPDEPAQPAAAAAARAEADGEAVAAAPAEAEAAAAAGEPEQGESREARADEEGAAAATAGVAPSTPPHPAAAAPPVAESPDSFLEDPPAAAGRGGGASRVFSRNKGRQPWSVDETRALLCGMRKHGQHWASIVESHGMTFRTNRSQVDLKDKWRNLAKQHANGYVGMRTALPDDVKVLIRRLVDRNAEFDEEAEAGDAEAAGEDQQQNKRRREDGPSGA